MGVCRPSAAIVRAKIPGRGAGFGTTQMRDGCCRPAMSFSSNEPPHRRDEPGRISQGGRIGIRGLDVLLGLGESVWQVEALRFAAVAILTERCGGQAGFQGGQIEA